MELGEHRGLTQKAPAVATKTHEQPKHLPDVQQDVAKPEAASNGGGSGSGHGGNLSGVSSEDRTSNECHTLTGVRQALKQAYWRTCHSTRVGLVRVLAVEMIRWLVVRPKYPMTYIWFSTSTTTSALDNTQQCTSSCGAVVQPASRQAGPVLAAPHAGTGASTTGTRSNNQKPHVLRLLRLLLLVHREF
jgi:hypothetical protein